MPTLPKIIAVVGPTASGKTALGAFLAKEFGGEIVSADAKQVYRGMDIGTAKEKDLDVPQHLLDIREPGEKITVGDYQALAYEVIDRLLVEQKLPILVGGSGLYAESVLEGYVFGGPGTKEKKPRYQSLKLAIDIPRDELKRRARVRLDQRIDQGLVEEVQGLLDEGVCPDWLRSCGIEYRYFSSYLIGEISLEAAREKTAIATDQFIKRQYTWWRRHSDLIWVKDIDEARGLVQPFLERE
ncbi:MAG: tRNA (adenosine(37)-N6)-dimethylallyltransferase MiaA [bacterium]